MESNLETKINKEENWLKKAFKEEWPTMGNHLIACSTAIGSATSFSHYAPKFFDSDATISGMATVIDFIGYYGVLLPQLLFRDRKKLKDNEGKLSKRKVVKKFGEYFSYIGILEGLYTVGRFLGQYELQKRGWDPAAASLAVQLSGTVFFTVALPPLRYAVRQWSEK